jgi:hypothetical protein
LYTGLAIILCVGVLVIGLVYSARRNGLGKDRRDHGPGGGPDGGESYNYSSHDSSDGGGGGGDGGDGGGD